MNFTTLPPGFRPVRHDRLVQEEVHDTYKSAGKLPEPTVCPDCGAVFENGGWHWADHRPNNAHREICPACRRLRDNFPAGFVSLEGAFFLAHRDEIINLVRQEEEREQREHALKRIMATVEKEAGVLITTTDIHLARAIGKAIQSAYRGELEFLYNAAENLLRVHWRR